MMFSMHDALIPYSPPSPVTLAAGSLGVADSRRVRRLGHSVSSTKRESLTLGAERLLRRDPVYRRRVREVLERQRKLRKRVDAAGFRAYLELEEAEVARWSYALDEVMVWAFQRGRRERRR